MKALTFALLLFPVASALASTAPVESGTYVRIDGVRTDFATIGGEGPLAVDYSMALTQALEVKDESGTIQSDAIYVRHGGRNVLDGTPMTLCGRVSIERYPGIEVPQHADLMLDHVTFVSAGQPCYDGTRFTTLNNDELPAAWMRNYPDAPQHRIVIGNGGELAWITTEDGFMPWLRTAIFRMDSLHTRAPNEHESSVDVSTMTKLDLKYTHTERTADLYYDAHNHRAYLMNAGSVLRILEGFPKV